MKEKVLVALCFFLIVGGKLSSQTENKTTGSFTIEWEGGTGTGSISATNGKIARIEAVKGNVRIDGNAYRIRNASGARLECFVDSADTKIGPEATLIHVEAPQGSFSFFLRDVNRNTPIYIPNYKVTVLPAGDGRCYAEVEREILSRKSRTKIERIETEPEVSFETAAARARRSNVPIWLGMGRDIRMFEISEELPDGTLEDKLIRPIFSSSPVVLPETAPSALYYRYALGRGVGVMDNIARHLDEGVLPIYHSELTDDDVRYHSVSFVSLEKSELNAGNVQGTHFLISDSRSGGRVFTETQQKQLADIQAAIPPADEEAVLYIRTEIENEGAVPRYAWIKAPRPAMPTNNLYIGAAYQFDREKGFSFFSEDRVFCISTIKGKPLCNEELAVLLQPGERIEVNFYIPHEPVSRQRAEELAAQSFEKRYEACKAYWNGKLERAARIHVPEKRIDEMVRAGLLHLDLVTFGQEPDGTLAANVGVYSPIGTESAPIIQFYASMGLNDLARRALNYFIETQQENGKIENYNGYMVETGAVLWSVGEYFRYTRDKEWIGEIKPALLKACRYLTEWRNRSKKDSLRGRGYGMIDGKVADPEDYFHQFMLNGYGYLGMKRMGEVFEAIGAEEAESLQKEAADWRNDIRESLERTMALSPVVPLGDGTWSPTAPPWTEAPGPRLLYQQAECFRSHGTFTVPDAMLGPMYLVFCEVIDPAEPVSNLLLKYHSELMFQENSTFSQPYYSRHNWLQAKKGMVKPFLSTYYHTMAPYADPGTYTFWEHLYKLSPHKPHEEANFLMETRWMLYMEDADTLNLFRVIPRRWMADGDRIELSGVQSYFGPLNVRAVSNVRNNRIEASVRCDPARKPACVKIRLPHPEGKKPVRVTGGTYNADDETVVVRPFDGETEIRLEF